MEEIKDLYMCLEKGYNSLPLDLPGTSYRKAMKVKIKILYQVLNLSHVSYFLSHLTAMHICVMEVVKKKNTSSV